MFQQKNDASMKHRRVFAFFVLPLFFIGGVVFAQSVETANLSAGDKQAQLEQQLSDINLEISGLNNTITDLKGQGQSLDRDIKLLSANIDRANLNIKAKNL